MGRSRYGDFQIIDELGRGGMATVYRAISAETGREVALKVCRSDDEDFIERFVRESHAIRSLRHRNVIRIVDVGPRKAPYWYAMELIQGDVLKDVLAADPPPRLQALVDLGLQMAEALDFAHQNGIYHRDVKPSNVLVEVGGRAVLTDFGLAKFDDFARGYTRSGMLLGTFLYMAPEQMDGRFHGAATDIYQLGLVLYEMFTGGLPFAELASVRAMVTERFRAAIPSIRSSTPRVSGELDDLVCRCLETEAGDRPASVDMIATLLRRELRRLGEGGAASSADGMAEADATVIRRKEIESGEAIEESGAESTTLEPVGRRVKRSWVRPVSALAVLLSAGLVVAWGLGSAPWRRSSGAGVEAVAAQEISAVEALAREAVQGLFREELIGKSFFEDRPLAPDDGAIHREEEAARRALAGEASDDPVIMDRLARCLALRRRWTGAARVLEDQRRRLPDDLSRRSAAVRYAMGRLAFLRGDFEKACEAFAGAAQKAPDWEPPRFGLAMAYLFKGNAAVAHRYLGGKGRAGSLRDRIGRALVRILRGRDGQGELLRGLDAPDWTDPVFDRTTGRSLLFEFLAVGCVRRADWSRGLGYLDEARALATRPSTLRLAAYMEERLGRPEQATRRLEEALRLDGNGMDGWIALCRGRLKAGRIPEAREAFDRIRALVAQDLDEAERFAGELAAGGRGDWAAELAGNVLAVEPARARAGALAKVAEKPSEKQEEGR